MRRDEFRCEPLPRSLTKLEQQVLDKRMAEYKATNRCDPHFGLPLWGPTSGPLHGCLVCGKPVA